jgi:hypothetical protein
VRHRRAEPIYGRRTTQSVAPGTTGSRAAGQKGERAAEELGQLVADGVTVETIVGAAARSSETCAEAIHHRAAPPNAVSLRSLGQHQLLLLTAHNLHPLHQRAALGPADEPGARHLPSHHGLDEPFAIGQVVEFEPPSRVARG